MMNAAAFLPESVLDGARFLRAELAPAPWRINLALRCVLASAIVIVTSMTLAVPTLAISLIAVFYVTQSNVVITRLAGMLFVLGVTLAVGISLLLIKFTFDHPLLRITAASLVCFLSLWLMRILKISPVFFLIALIVMYAQSFVDESPPPDLLVRQILWVWVAASYGIAVTLLVNAWLLPLEPVRQLKAAIHRVLAQVDAVLARLAHGVALEPAAPTGESLEAMLAMEKLLKFAAMRDARVRAEQAYLLATIAAASRLQQAAAALPAVLPAPSADALAALQRLRADCRALDAAVQDGTPFRLAEPGPNPVLDQVAGLGTMRRTLDALAGYAADGAQGAAEAPMVAPDAFSNPAYLRFALKTLLALLVSYVFYTAVQWPGVHTVMLTCVIVALPSLGAAAQKALLRIGGAVLGSLAALACVVFVIPRLDGIVGLLLMTLPIVALGAWLAAGSERISYAGIQVVFTFALAVLERFGPTTDLTEIRDRIVGIFLGIGVSAAIQILIWPEGEADELRRQLAALLRSAAALIRLAAQAPPLPYARQHLRTWTEFGTAKATLARVVLEPVWSEGENAMVTLRAQSILATVRQMLAAADALRERLAGPDGRTPERRAAASALLQHVAGELERYAAAIATDPPAAQTPPTARAVELEAGQELLRQLGGLPAWPPAGGERKP